MLLSGTRGWSGFLWQPGMGRGENSHTGSFLLILPHRSNMAHKLVGVCCRKSRGRWGEGSNSYCQIPWSFQERGRGYAQRETNVRAILRLSSLSLVCVEQRIIEISLGTLKRQHSGLIGRTRDINKFFTS